MKLVWTVAVALLAMLAMGGCAGARAMPAPVVRTERYADLIMCLPAWTSDVDDFRAGEWQDYLDVARILQTRRAEEVNRILETFSTRAQRIEFETWAGVETKAFLLLRIMFDLPCDAPAVKRRTYIGLLNWPKEQDSYDLSWPIQWQRGRPRLAARYHGRVGRRYLVAEEFAYFRSNFAYRDLSELASTGVGETQE